uniref:Uncharacterized protein n=1 Tax=Leviviridae sp. TaxID=2027243 RepID=A0A514D9A0_9VIRU|nr:MAG: hypothetical protein H3BulkL171584e2861_000003 [Leviviridae sp.]
MSAQTALVINDGATTPVAHTFDPKGARSQPQGKDIAVWRDAAQANLVAAWTVEEQHTPVNGNSIEKFRYLITLPYTEPDLNGNPVQKRFTLGEIQVYAHQLATDVELKNIAALVKNFTASTYFQNAITKREAAW